MKIEIKIPKDWKKDVIGNLFSFNGGLSKSRDDLGNIGICYLHYGDIHTTTSSILNVDESFESLPKLNIKMDHKYQRFLLHDGDIVFVDASEDYEGVSRYQVIKNDNNIPLLSGLHTIVARENYRVLDNGFKRYAFAHFDIRKQFMYFAAGQKVKGINKTNIKKIEIRIPPMKEQVKIAEILSAWDTAIKKNKEIYDLMNEEYSSHKKKLLRHAFSRNSLWTATKIGDIMIQESIKTTINNEFPVLSSTIESIFLQDEYFNRQIASSNNIGYKVLKMNRIVMSPQNAWMGNINYNDKYSSGIVSPSYKIFKIENACPLFIKHLIKTKRFIHIIDSFSEQGASIVRKNLNLTEFLDQTIHLPSLGEQKRIASLLESYSKAIELKNEEIKCYENQKKGLMQQLLTGKIRVQV